jgi:hypothetical protein
MNAKGFIYPHQFSDNFTICKMSTIPGDKIINIMYRGDGKKQHREKISPGSPIFPYKSEPFLRPYRLIPDKENLLTPPAFF